MELRALLIKKPFIDQILSGQKTWELRGSASKIRGQIALIESGSGTVVGTCELVDVVGPLSKQDLKKNAAKLNAKASDFDGPLYYAKTYAWVLKSAKRLKTPVPYDHASGAVIWVKLDARVAKRVRR